ncbi:MAG: M28 family peptidase [Caldilineaceae bacterium]|nr:M28 family peptidase [Caldilineaceae bacterium]
MDSTGHRLCLVFVNGEANRGLDGWETSHGIDYFLIGLRNGQVEQCANPRFAVVLDLVGGANQQIFVERTSDVGLSTELWGTARSLGYEENIVPEVKWLARGPHAALNRAGIPSAVMLDYDYAYRDTTQDTVDKLDAESFAAWDVCWPTGWNGAHPWTRNEAGRRGRTASATSGRHGIW